VLNYRRQIVNRYIAGGRGGLLAHTGIVALTANPL